MFGIRINNRGMALLITLTIITLLIVTVTELNRRARATIVSAARVRDLDVLAEMTRSGVHAAMAILAEDRQNSEIDSLQEDWANPEAIEDLLRGFSFEEGQLAMVISDTRARIQVNALVNFPQGRDFNPAQVPLWERFLRIAFLAHETQEETDPVNTVINSLKDWMDSGDDDAITGLTGAESDYYGELDPPYACRNGPFTHLNEVLQVKGVTPEVFYGTEEIPGISSFLTVGAMTDDGGGRPTFDGKININTAEMPVLATLLPEENQELALAIDEYRQEKTGDVFTHELSSGTWYKNVPGAGDITIDSNLITTRSDFFTIETSARLNDLMLTAVVTLKRELDENSNRIRFRVLSWEQY